MADIPSGWEPVEAQAAPDSVPAGWQGVPQGWEPVQSDEPQVSGAEEFARRGARGVAALPGMLVGAGAGAEIGGTLGAMTGPLAPAAVPVGAFVGAGIGGYLGASKMNDFNDWLLGKLGLKEGEGFFSDVREQAGAKQHPNAAFAGDIVGMAPAVTATAPAALVAKFGQTGARLLSAAGWGGFEAAQQGLTEGKIDPSHVLAMSLVGGAFPGQRGWAEKTANVGAAPVRAAADKLGLTPKPTNATAEQPIEATATAADAAPVAERPYDPMRVDEGFDSAGAQQSRVDATDGASAPPKVARGASESPPPPREPTENIGVNEDNKPVRDAGNDGKYKKQTETPTEVTQDAVPQDVSLALLPDADMARFQAAAEAKKKQPRKAPGNPEEVKQSAVERLVEKGTTPEEAKKQVDELTAQYEQLQASQQAPGKRPWKDNPNNPANWPKDRNISDQTAPEKPVVAPPESVKPVTAAVTPPEIQAPKKRGSATPEAIAKRVQARQAGPNNALAQRLAWMDANGHTDAAARIRAVPNRDAQVKLANQYFNSVTSKTGNVSKVTNRAIPPRQVVEGSPEVTAKSYEAADKKSAIRKARDELFKTKEFGPNPNETAAEGYERAKSIMEKANESGATAGKKELGPTPRNDPEHKRAFDWLRAVRDYVKDYDRLKGDTQRQANHTEFLASEYDIRGEGYEPEKKGRAETARAPIEAAEVQAAHKEITQAHEEPLSIEDAQMMYESSQEALAHAIEKKDGKNIQRLAVKVGEANQQLKYAKQAEETRAKSAPTPEQPVLSDLAGEKAPTKPVETAAEKEAARKARVAAYLKEKEAPKVETQTTKTPDDMLERLKAQKAEGPREVAGEKTFGAEEKRGVLKTVSDALKDETGSINVGKIDKEVTALVGRVQEILKGTVKWVKDIPDRMKPTGDQFSKARLTEQSRAAHEVWQNLHLLEQRRLSHNAAVVSMLERLPASVKSVTESIFKKMELDKGVSMTPTERAVFDKYFKSMYEQNKQLFKLAHELAPDYAKEIIGPSVENYMMHILLNPTKERNMFGQSERMAENPIEGIKNITRVAGGPLLKRTFVEIEPVKGGPNKVVQKEGSTLAVWENGHKTMVKNANFEFEAGKGWVDPRTQDAYTMRDAQAVNVEQHARLAGNRPVKFAKDAALSIALSNMHLAEFVDRMAFLAELKKSPQFEQYASRKKLGDDWKLTDNPQFKGYYMEPNLRRVMDQHAQPGLNVWGIEKVRQLSRLATNTLFWLPVVHLLNVQGHWTVGRGFDWFKPEGWKNLVQTVGPAVKDVLESGPVQHEILRANGSLPSMSQQFSNPLERAAKTLGHEMEKHLPKWDPIAHIMGISSKDLVKGIYNASNKALWAGNDMFYTQLYLEAKKSGMSPEVAVAHVERHFPSYRISPTIMMNSEFGGLMSRVMADPTVSAYGRYHTNWWNSWAHIAKDLVGGTGQQRVEALGNLTVAGMMAYFMYPAMDWAIQKLTGNRFAEARRRGPLSIPSHVWAALNGKEDIASAARSTLTVSPLASTFLEGLSGKNWMGKPIIEPGTMSRAASGSLKAGVKAGVQFAEWAGTGLFAPLGTYEQASRGNKTLAEALRNQVFDIKDTSPKAIKYQAGAIKRETQREKHPPGAIEGLYNRLTR